MTPETRQILAHFAEGFLILLVFLVLCAATVVLYMLWRGLLVARREGPAYVWRVLEYVGAAEAQARNTAHTSLDPQIRIVSGWAGAKAAARALIGGPAALPAGDDESAPV
jgi:hypothetical protein